MQWKKWTHITNHLFDIYAFIISYHYILISKFSIKSVKRVCSLLLFCLLKIFFEVFYFVHFFPWKIHICTSKVTISCRLFVDWSSQVKHTNDSSRTKVEILTDNLNKFSIRNFTCSKCIYIDGSRSCNSDCVRKLDFAFISQKLDEISLAVDSLNLWVDKTASENDLNVTLLREEKERLKKQK